MVQKQSSWKFKSAVLVTENNGFEMIVRGLLKQLKWSLTGSMKTIREAYEFVLKGEAEIILIDEAQQLPALYQYRCLLSEPFGSLVPTMLLDSDQVTQDVTVAKGLYPAVTRVSKPLSFARFSPQFKDLIKTWESKSHILLRTSLPKLKYLEGHLQIALLSKLLELPATASRVMFSLSILGPKQGNIEAVERLLLGNIKSSPRDIIPLLGLVQLYNSYCASHLAVRILEGARRNWGDSIFFMVDLIQAKVFLNDFAGAETLIRLLLARNTLEQELNPTLTKLLIADGRTELASYTMKKNRRLLDKILQDWESTKIREGA